MTDENSLNDPPNTVVFLDRVGAVVIQNNVNILSQESTLLPNAKSLTHAGKCKLKFASSRPVRGN